MIRAAKIESEGLVAQWYGPLPRPFLVTVAHQKTLSRLSNAFRPTPAPRGAPYSYQPGSCSGRHWCRATWPDMRGALMGIILLIMNAVWFWEISLLLMSFFFTFHSLRLLCCRNFQAFFYCFFCTVWMGVQFLSTITSVLDIDPFILRAKFWS